MEALPTLTAHEPGLVKVRISFETWEPQHMRSHALRTELFVKPPYVEDVCVLLRVGQVTTHRATYDNLLSSLIDLSLVPQRSRVVHFELLVGEKVTLAYRMDHLS
jgi:hypothetical protein